MNQKNTNLQKTIYEYAKRKKQKFNFYRLINLENACPRKTILSLSMIKGISQYYPNKQTYLRNKVFEYLIDKFDLDTISDSFQKVDENFVERLEKEGTSELITNLEHLIHENEIIIHEINKPFSYVTDGFATEIYVDGIGSFRGQHSIFKFNLTSRFNRQNALELALVESQLHNDGDAIERLIDLKLGSGDYREILKQGDLTKNGKLSARGLSPWEDLQKEAKKLLKNGYKLLKKMETNSDSYNTPMFGPCNTCPYHNIKIEFHGKKIICTG
ncbi:MAG: hypothetical protein ACFFA0_11500 [Promethearchaeota archaeon]